MTGGFTSYCDEFGSPKDPIKRVTGIAGLLAWSDDWIKLTKKWEKIQEDEHVPPFHMTDFVHHTEDFSDKRWESAKERERILGLFLEAIGETHVIPVGAAVILKDFNELSEDHKGQLVSPYYVAFQSVTLNLGFATANKCLLTASRREDFVANRVAMVYAKLKKFTGPAEELWNEIKSANLFGHWMDTYTAEEPRGLPPLQAADIWAYSLGHMHEHRPPKKKEAQLAFNFFVQSARHGWELGHKFYEVFDRKEMLLRLGEPPEVRE
jgi:hypothetical protein